MSTYLTWIADALRAAGLEVTEVQGWQTRARSSGGYASGRPWCIMWHHTASDTTPQNDVDYIVSGSPDAPLANLYLARSGAVWVCAAGATNTNGKGGPLAVSRGTVPADSMNTHAVGIEAANNGTGEVWPQAQIDAYFVINATLAFELELDAADLATHAAWAPGRKIDPAVAAAVAGPWQPGAINASGTWNVADVRAEAVRRAGATPPTPTPTPPPDEETAMHLTIVTVIDSGAVFLGLSNGLIAPWVEWINGNDPDQLDRYEAYRARVGVDVLTMSIGPGDFRNATLLGPVPHGDRITWSADMFGNVIGA